MTSNNIGMGACLLGEAFDLEKSDSLRGKVNLLIESFAMRKKILHINAQWPYAMDGIFE
jgi:hypothetical protein